MPHHILPTTTTHSFLFLFSVSFCFASGLCLYSADAADRVCIILEPGKDRVNFHVRIEIKVESLRAAEERQKDTKIWISQSKKKVKDRKMLLQLRGVDEPTLKMWESKVDHGVTSRLCQAIVKILKFKNITQERAFEIPLFNAFTKKDFEDFLKGQNPQERRTTIVERNERGPQSP